MADKALKADAQKIVNHLLEHVSIQEGTVIIYNGGEDPQVIGQGGGAPPQQQQRPGSKEVTIGGKRWHFEITRNEDGQITGLDVEQL
jgi:hypothetical protein